MKENTKIGVIILAAGSSSRLGYPKQLVKFKGKTLLQHSIDIANSLKFKVKILVLGANAKKIEKQIDCRHFKIVHNENWEEGMGTSISRGISESLNLYNDLDHILMLLSDQPFITSEKIQDLIRVQNSTKMSAVFSEYAGNIGVPAIFSRTLFSDLKGLKGDLGAKKLLKNKSFEFGTVQFEKGNFDIDTAADVTLLKQVEKGC